jgi:methionyl-tRNA formyltransferase
VTFNTLPPLFHLVQQWAAQAGHTIVLTVTTPGPRSRRSEGYKQIVASAPPDREVLVTTRLRTVALPLIRAVQPDLIISASFPYRIPPEIYALARLGAVNLHPSLLPAYRGPNPLRSIYDGVPLAGATLHWMDEDFDTGRILCQQAIELPDALSMGWFGSTWMATLAATLAEGVRRAITGETGEVQDQTGASYGARFAEAEYWLDWELPGRRLHQQCFALAVGGEHGMGPRARIAGRTYAIRQVTPLPLGQTGHASGSLINQDAEGLIVACADGAVRVVVAPLADDGA